MVKRNVKSVPNIILFNKKKCARCNLEKELSEFNRFNCSRSKLQIQSYCRDCSKECWREYKLKNKKRLRKNWRNHYHSNKDRLLPSARLRSKEQYKKNPSYQKNRNYERAGTLALKRRGLCSICDKKEITVGHHILPRWFSKDDSKENLIEVCKSCHKRFDYHILAFLAGRYNE